MSANGSTLVDHRGVAVMVMVMVVVAVVRDHNGFRIGGGAERSEADYGTAESEDGFHRVCGKIGG